MRDSDLLGGVVKEVAQELLQSFGGSVVEAGGDETLADSGCTYGDTQR